MGRLTQRLYRQWLAQNGQDRPSAGNGLGRPEWSSRSMPVPPLPQTPKTPGKAPAGGGSPSSSSRPDSLSTREAPRGTDKRYSFISRGKDFNRDQ